MEQKQQKTDEQMLEESAKRFVEDFKHLMNNELAMARQDFNFYTKVNNVASQKIDKIGEIIKSNERSVEVIQQSYEELREYKRYVDELESTLDEIELTITQLDEQTKMIEASFRAVERRLAQQALKK